MKNHKLLIFLLVLLVLVIAFCLYRKHQILEAERKVQFASGNGRLEATEVYITSDLGGEIREIKVERGTLVRTGDVLVLMDTRRLNADLQSMEAKKIQSLASEKSAEAQVVVAESGVKVAQAEVEQAETLLKNAESRYERQKGLLEKDAATKQDFENAEANWLSNCAELVSAKAKLDEAVASLEVAKANVLGAQAETKAIEANIDSIKVDLDKSVLKAPRDGRIQYHIAETGEVIEAGGRVLNLADMTDVYLAFFLPARQAGRLKIGAEARIFLDALPDSAVPATVTYVASTAQFTPKTVETESEREKMMFRVEARVNQKLLQTYIDYVKTGMPGVAWVKLDEAAEWPENMQPKSEVEGE